MLNFDVPLIHENSSPREAFAVMAKASRSGLVTRGLVIRVGTDVRLLHCDVILAADQGGTRKLRDISQFENVKFLDPSTDYADILKTAGLRFGMLGVREIAKLVSLSEVFADVFLTSPPGARCTGTPSHDYPPNKRDRHQPNVCVIDGSYLP